jgi:sugar/nucleoside kinase (ribokinase family)
MPLVACVGLVASDFLAPVSFPVPRDVKVRVNGFARQGGGPAANAAVALRRLGIRAAFLGAVGDDALGRRQMEELAAEEVDVSGVTVTAGAASFVSFILVDRADGARTIFSAPDERPLLARGARLPEPPPHLVLMDGWGGPAGLELARQARERGIPVLVDAGTHRKDVTDLLPYAEVAIVSEPFAAAMAGADRPEAAVELIAAQGPRLVAVTRGARSVIAGARGTKERFEVPAFPVAAVDTTGAGDAFHGGAAWALARGLGWEEALRAGAAVAALKCRHPGARDGLPGRKEVDRLLAAGISPGSAA